jgi:hypothetical protein
MPLIDYELTSCGYDVRKIEFVGLEICAMEK